MTKSAALDDPIEYLFELMNDERLSRMQRGAIAKKIAPYFHPKLKPVPPGTMATFPSTIAEDPAEEEAESVAVRREHFRRRLFKDFD